MHQNQIEAREKQELANFYRSRLPILERDLKAETNETDKINLQKKADQYKALITRLEREAYAHSMADRGEYPSR